MEGEPTIKLSLIMTKSKFSHYLLLTANYLFIQIKFHYVSIDISQVRQAAQLIALQR